MLTAHSLCYRIPAACLGAALLLTAFGPPVQAQGLFDRLKEAAANTVNEAKEAATNAARDEAMNQAGFLMLAEGAFAGTATPWVQNGEPAAFAEIPGNAYVSPDRLAIVLCQEGALDGVVFQGDFANVAAEREMAFADDAFAVFLVQDGRAAPMRNTAGQLGSFTSGLLDVRPGDAGGLMGTVSLAIGEDAVSGAFLSELFARSRVVEIEGSFRATPVESIEQVSCESGATGQAAPRQAAPSGEPSSSSYASAGTPPPPAARSASAEQRRAARSAARQRSASPPPDGGASEPEVFVVVENPPELIGGLEGLQQRVRYPAAARRAGIEGTVFLQFIVDERGRVLDPVCARDPGGGTCEEALRVVRTSTFQPGLQRGQPVKVRFSLPVKFRL